METERETRHCLVFSFPALAEPCALCETHTHTHTTAPVTVTICVGNNGVAPNNPVSWRRSCLWIRCFYCLNVIFPFCYFSDVPGFSSGIKQQHLFTNLQDYDLGCVFIAFFPIISVTDKSSPK